MLAVAMCILVGLICVVRYRAHRDKYDRRACWLLGGHDRGRHAEWCPDYEGTSAN